MDCLDGVHQEDRPIVRNAVAAIQCLKKEKVLSSWTIGTEGGCYVVTAFLLDNVECEFSVRELEIIHDISPLRVRSVSMGKIGTRVVLKVRISTRDEPVTLEETSLVHVRKRTRWMG